MIMYLNEQYHLSYCTNIHPTQNWVDTFDYLKTYTTGIKQAIAPNKPFGVGLRLSNQASEELLASGQIHFFKDWLNEQGLYVFTMNAFPYGGFHRQRVKEQVHHPDWRDPLRLLYTNRLIDQLAFLLPNGMEGGLSTSPITYKHWLQNKKEVNKAFQIGAHQLLQVIDKLDVLYRQSGQLIHLDIEPEPDGLIENTKETIHFYHEILLPLAQEYFKAKYRSIDIEEIVFRHLQLCYDVCHFAVAFEDPKTAITALQNAGIRIGKIQISAALKANLIGGPLHRQQIKTAFGAFNESTYLHQVIGQHQDGSLVQFPDLPPALDAIMQDELHAYRAHFHVPLFIEKYGLLESTQQDIIDTLSFLRENPFTKHLEIETYTWEVLPPSMQLDLKESIIREFQWVLNQF